MAWKEDQFEAEMHWKNWVLMQECIVVVKKKNLEKKKFSKKKNFQKKKILKKKISKKKKI